jgi:hypothetical protein
MNESDARCLESLERFEITGPFRHRDHVRAAWLLVERHGADRAAAMMERVISKLAEHHGHAKKYHATLTRAWVRLVAFHAGCHPAASFDDFIAHNAALLDPELPLRFYSRDVLFCDAARDAWCDPDRRPLPHAR